MRCALTPLALLGAVVLVLPAAGDLEGQDVDSLRASWRIAVPEELAAAALSRPSSPATTSSSPTAFGAAWGDGFVGAGYQARTRYALGQDGTFVVGMGLGDPVRSLGLEVGLTSVSTLDDGPFRRGTVSLKLHRRLSGSWGAAVGWENATSFDFDPDEDPDGGRSWYAVLSKVWGFDRSAPRAVTLSAGVGDGRFRSESAVTDDRATVGVFGALAVQLLQPVSLLADWSGQDLAVGASVAPLRGVPVVATAAVTDLTGSAGDGARFILGVGMTFRFLDLPAAPGPRP